MNDYLLSANPLPLPPQRIVHPRFCRMAVVAKRCEVAFSIVPTIHKGSSVIDFKLVGTAADHAAIPIPGLHDRLEGG